MEVIFFCILHSKTSSKSNINRSDIDTAVNMLRVTVEVILIEMTVALLLKFQD